MASAAIMPTRTSTAATHSRSAIESAYPRSRDRRLSRKTRAAVGKPPGSMNAMSAVSIADNPGVVAMPIGSMGRSRDDYCYGCKPHEIGAASAPFNSPLAESARPMPVNASPMPAHAGAFAGLIS